MMQYDDPPRSEGTVVDPRLAPRRLREGLVPEDTGIYLRVEEGAARGTVFTLSAGGVYVIGRDGADIAIPDEKVSRKHAEIGLYGPGAYVLRDLASTNGTLLNGKRVQEKARLSNWDVIRIGDTVIRFQMVEGSIPLES
ncbi:MAG TPA: FHA domain-containing protein [Candidatus Polarisedimenticolaceae bacterium]|nr:FHA domain-containing protein [Candidatus Polarisedimenticolaceae bacterium]